MSLKRPLSASVLIHLALLSAALWPATRSNTPYSPRVFNLAVITEPAETPTLARKPAPRRASHARIQPARPSPTLPSLQAAVDATARPTEMKATPEYCPTPEYPSYARARGWQGEARVAIETGNDGLVKAASLERTSGFALLDQAALEAAKRWKLSSARHLLVPFVFRLTATRSP